MTDQHCAAWQRALLAARITAIAGDRIGGVHLRARAGPVRDAWISYFTSLLPASTAWHRITPSVPLGRLIGGLDVARTLEAGRVRLEQGVLGAADGNVLLLSMAERASAEFAATIGTAMDNHGVRIERHGLSLFQPSHFTLICLDEGADDDETLRASLADRMAMRIDLSPVTWSEANQVPDAEDLSPLADWQMVELSADMDTALEQTLAAYKQRSMRTSVWLRRICQLVAADEGASTVLADHAALALQLVCSAAVVDTPLDQGAEQPEQQGDDQGRQQASEPSDHGAETPPEGEPAIPDEILVAAKSGVHLDINRLDQQGGALRMRGNRTAGKSGAAIRSGRRGRPIGVSPTPPYPDARLNIAATFRAAAPWQAARKDHRNKLTPGRSRPLDIRKSDFRYVRRRQRTEATVIFAVDASGSTALERLGEAKGAAELLLADCYTRREQVGVIGFRGTESEVLLPPTRSLVRAKRCLASLVGGGGTPLASGMVKALQLAVSSAHHGRKPLVVLITDGSANIALDGSAGRAAARRDADAVALQFRYNAIAAVVVDIARNKRGDISSLAKTMGAEYYALPRADAKSVSTVVASHLRAG